MWKLFYTARSAFDIITKLQLEEDEEYDPVFSVFQYESYTEKAGFSFIWFKSVHTNSDLFGRSLFGIYKSYDSIVIDFLFLRILIN